MAHIVDFQIVGLAGRKDVYAQELDRYVNVFFGLNGSGKTSLLKILTSAMSGDASTLTDVPFESARVTIHSIGHDTDFVRKIEKPRRPKQARTKKGTVVVQHSRAKNVVADISLPEVRVIEGDEPLCWVYEGPIPRRPELRWLHIYLPTWRLNMVDDVRSSRASYGTREDRPHVEDWDAVFARTLESLWLRYSRDLYSHISEIQQKGLADVLRSVLKTGAGRRRTAGLDSETAYQRAKAFLGRQGTSEALGTFEAFAQRFTTDTGFRRVVRDINSVELAIEGISAPRSKLEELIANMFSGNKKVVFGERAISVETEDGQKIGVQTLSSGEKHILAIFIDALMADVSTLLIDEPELSLHLDWQEDLIGSMRLLNAETQLILATHSPAIMADLDEEFIFRL